MTTERRFTVPAGDLVLHHYWMSPYAEKVRCILGFKRLPWKSVLIPIVIAGFGHGTYEEMSSAAAVEIARVATPQTAFSSDPGDPNARRSGERVSVVHADFGRDPVVGELVASSVHEIAIRRRDEHVGEVIVHLPRERYVVLPA